MQASAIDSHEVKELPDTVQFKRAFLAQLSAALKHERLRAGLSRREAASRAELAEDLLDQVEIESPGNLTFEQFVDVALAYGTVPLDITLAAQGDVQEFVEQMPGKPRTLTNFEAWKARRGVQRALALAAESARQ